MSADRPLTEEAFRHILVLVNPGHSTAPLSLGILIDEARRARASEEALAERVKRLEGALRFQDPRNASERYDRIADDFFRETGRWPPGRSMPAAMGGDPFDPMETQQMWRKFCNEWHEKFFDDALSTPSPTGEPPPRTVKERIDELANDYGAMCECGHRKGMHWHGETGVKDCAAKDERCPCQAFAPKEPTK